MRAAGRVTPRSQLARAGFVDLGEAARAVRSGRRPRRERWIVGVGSAAGLVLAAGIADIPLDGKFVAIKMHFGEPGNLAFLRANYARALVDVLKEKGAHPFLTDCNTMYPGRRRNALDHLDPPHSTPIQ